MTMQAAAPFLDLLFPRSCCSCGAVLRAPGETGLCWDCRSASLPIAPPWCECCGMVIAGRVDHAFTCSKCEEHKPAYDQARSLFRYEGGIRDAIHALKYHNDFSVIPDLALLVRAGIGVHVPVTADTVLAPVPLHPRKHRERGYNQSGEILRLVKNGLPVWTGVRRVKDTETQTHLSAAGRRENVRGAFAADKGSVPGHIILFDDVMTTGSTVDACARALRRAGAHTIHVLTLARG